MRTRARKQRARKDPVLCARHARARYARARAADGVRVSVRACCMLRVLCRHVYCFSRHDVDAAFAAIDAAD